MNEKNLENVTHEEAVATLKCTSDRVVLVVAKVDAPPAPPLSQSSVNLTTTHYPAPPPASPTPPLGKQISKNKIIYNNNNDKKKNI